MWKNIPIYRDKANQHNKSQSDCNGFFRLFKTLCGEIPASAWVSGGLDPGIDGGLTPGGGL
jgi:hypothetical protein